MSDICEENSVDIFGPEFDKLGETEATQNLLASCNNTNDEDIIELTPVEDQSSSKPASTSSRKRRTRQPRSKWTPSEAPLDEKVRPGKKPKIADADCDDLERRNRRRIQNKEAAKRQREKRQAKVNELEEQVSQLKAELEKNLEENTSLHQELDRLRGLLQIRQPRMISNAEMASVEDAVNTVQPNVENQQSNEEPDFLEHLFNIYWMNFDSLFRLHNATVIQLLFAAS